MEAVANNAVTANTVANLNNATTEELQTLLSNAQNAVKNCITEREILRDAKAEVVSKRNSILAQANPLNEEIKNFTTEIDKINKTLTTAQHIAAMLRNKLQEIKLNNTIANLQAKATATQATNTTANTTANTAVTTTKVKK